MTVRELRKLHGRLVTVEASLRLLQADDPSLEISAAWGWVTKRREQLEGEIAERAIPQRARKTPNVPRNAWAVMHRNVRGIQADLIVSGEHDDDCRCDPCVRAMAWAQEFGA